jgi:hypothetical protein
MADVLRIKRRAVGGAAGPPATLAAAEIAFNEVDNTLYYGRGNSAGLATSIVPIAGNGGAVVTISDTAPTLPVAGQLWFDSVGARLYLYFTDPNTSQWVPVA